MASGVNDLQQATPLSLPPRKLTAVHSKARLGGGHLYTLGTWRKGGESNTAITEVPSCAKCSVVLAVAITALGYCCVLLVLAPAVIYIAIP